MTTKQDIDRIEFFHESAKDVDTPGDLRWRFIAAGNSAVMAGPEEGYKHLGDMIADVERVTHRKITHDIETAANMPTIYIFWSWVDEYPQRYLSGNPPLPAGGVWSSQPREQGMA